MVTVLVRLIPGFNDTSVPFKLTVFAPPPEILVWNTPLIKDELYKAGTVVFGAPAGSARPSLANSPPKVRNAAWFATSFSKLTATLM